MIDKSNEALKKAKNVSGILGQQQMPQNLRSLEN